MRKIVAMPDGTGVELEGEVQDNVWKVRTWRSNGVLERSAHPVVKWTEIGTRSCMPLTGQDYVDSLHALYGDDPDKLKRELKDFEEEEEERKARSLRASARRAKTTCRRSIIVEQFDEMLTLTYRANQEDRELCKQHFTLWVKRMKSALGRDESYVDKQGKARTRRVPGSFRYVASFEKQERGAYHVHICTHRLPETAFHRGVKVKAWEVGTRIWRDIVGADNGMCFVGGRGRHGVPRGRRMSLAKMANYVSKYILKDCESVPSGSNRYSRSDGIEVGKPESMVFNCTLADLMGLMYECPPGHRVVSHRISKWADSVWLCTEGPPL